MINRSKQGDVNLERMPEAECRRQKDQLQGDSNPPATVDHQIEDFGGGFEPKSKKDEGRFEPSALCPKTSALQGGSLGRLILEFLTLNRSDCYDVNDLSRILNINPSSVRTHCINLVNSGGRLFGGKLPTENATEQLIETHFYKHNSLRPRKRAALLCHVVWRFIYFKTLVQF